MAGQSKSLTRDPSSLRNSLISLPQAERLRLIASLPNDAAEALLYDWPFWARPEQLAPDGQWLVWLILAGRGFGKTRSGAEWIRAEAESGRRGRLAIVAPTAADARDVMVEGESGLLAIAPPWNRPVYEPSKRRLTWPNGAQATTYSADEPERLRGPQHDGAWCLAGDTRVLMADGDEKSLAAVRVGDYVQTRKGARRVTGSMLTKRNAQVYRLRALDGRVIVGTADHPVWVDGRGFVPMAQLSEGMLLCVTTASSWVGTPGTSGRGMATTSRVCFSTAMCGSRRMAPLRRDTTSITRMATSTTTGWRISNSSPTVNTVRCITKRSWRRIVRSRYLTRNRRRSASDKSGWNACCSARCAVANTTAVLSIHHGSVPLRALRQRAAALSAAKPACVNNAGVRIKPLVARSDIVLASAISAQASSARPRWSSERLHANNALRHSALGVATHASAVAHAPLLSTATIASVERLATRCDVYNIAVADAHEFFAEGILVHNCDEPASWRYPAAFDMLMFGLRLGSDPRAVVTGTPKPVKLIRDLYAAKTTVVSGGSTFDNAANLAPTFLHTVTAKYEGTRLGRQELHAEILTDTPGALWKRDQIEALRVSQLPPLVRIVVGIDPAVTSDEGSDETGVIVAGLGVDGHGYVLADYSMRASPDRWAREAVNAYYRHSADRVIAEVNNGGDLVEFTLRTVDANVSYKAVHASRGKLTRAEPVAALYEQGRIHHHATFPDLEDQLTTWTQGEKSPDRMDALVWCFTELMLGPTGEVAVASTRMGLTPEQRAIEDRANQAERVTALQQARLALAAALGATDSAADEQQHTESAEEAAARVAALEAAVAEAAQEARRVVSVRSDGTAQIYETDAERDARIENERSIATNLRYLESQFGLRPPGGFGADEW